MTYISNHVERVTIETGDFLMEQRNTGFADNDGQWTVHQSAELYWGPGGLLTQRRPGAHLGVFPTKEAALAAVHAAQPQPVDVKAVR